MNAIFLNDDEMFGYLTRRINKKAPKLNKVDIASYGMYLGITEDGKDWSDKFPSAARDFINAVANTTHRIIIGIPFFIECYIGCESCAFNYDKRLFRTSVTAKMLNLNIRYADKSHLKYYRVDDSLIIGGINLTQSGWVDMSVATKSTMRTRSMFDRLWRASAGSISVFYKSKDVEKLEKELQEYALLHKNTVD